MVPIKILYGRTVFFADGFTYTNCLAPVARRDGTASECCQSWQHVLFEASTSGSRGDRLLQQNPINPSNRQWKNVYITKFSENQETLAIATKDESSTENCEIDVADLEHFTTRRLPGFRFRALHLYLKNKKWYGPFEFRSGGISDFVNTLAEVVDVKRSPKDNTLFEVRLRPSVYKLPSSTTGGSIGQKWGNAFVEVGSTLQLARKAMKSAIIDTILIPSSSLSVVVDNQGPSRSVYAASQHGPAVDITKLKTTKEDAGFQVIDVRPPRLTLPDIPVVQRGEPLSLQQWKRHLDPFGRVTCVKKLRKIIFEGGIDEALRPTVWKYLLGYYLWDNTAEENDNRSLEKHREYQMLKAFWKEMSMDRFVRFSLLRDRKSYIDKDVPRTDRKISFYRDDSDSNLTKLYDILMTYTVYNMDLGYYQGMNDLLAVVLYTVHQEEDAFWCFVGLMERLESNFDGNLNAVIEQFFQLFELVDVFDPAFGEYLENKNAKEMLFCFRWLLIQFKREFAYTDVMKLWEAIWSDYSTNNFHVFFAAAVLISERSTIMEQDYDAINILKHINDLSFNIPLDKTLILATRYVQQLDTALEKLTASTRDILEGPSLAHHKHSTKKENQKSGTNSPRLDYNWGLLNDEIEDLMTIDASKETRQFSTAELSDPIMSAASGATYLSDTSEGQHYGRTYQTSSSNTSCIMEDVTGKNSSIRHG